MILQRVFAAPIERAFAAWTNPELLARWWGPAGCKTVSCELDVREGGQWRTVMRGPDGTAYAHSGSYTVVDPPNALEFTWALETEAGLAHQSTIAVRFVAQGDATEMTFEHKPDAAASSTAAAAEGWRSSIDRLGAEPWNT